MLSSHSKRKMERSCQTCQKRKIKCDRTPGTCNRCRAFGEECIYSGPGKHTRDQLDQLVTQAGLRRRRILRSCWECKRSKVKCTGSAMCERCRRKGLECSYRRPAAEASIQRPQTMSSSSPLPRGKQLPSLQQVRELLDTYFTRIHTVRCLGFIHIPSFMDRLPSLYSGGSGLLFIMCALAAPFHHGLIPDAGKDWAEQAQHTVFSDFGHLGIDLLMTAILLHEYYLRAGECSKAFLISGLIARHVQVLQLNLEYDYDIYCHQSQISAAVKETRRRLLWAVYLLDSFIECGIDQLRLVSADDIQVQLPCLEDLFIRNVPSVTETLSGQVLPFISPSLSAGAASNLDMRAFYIRVMAIRSQILRYVKNLKGEVPWEENSQFHVLDGLLRDLESSLPETLNRRPENVYIFKASGRLSLFFGLHILLAQSHNDLYRIGVSGLVFPNTATEWIRQNAPNDFIARCHDTCIRKAVHIATCLDELWHLDKLSLVDVPYAVHAQICSSVIVTTLMSWSGPDVLLPHISHQQYHHMLQVNVDILHLLQRYMNVDLYSESATQALKRFEMFSSSQVPLLKDTQADTDDSCTPPQFSLDYILNPLGTYPMARKQVGDRHEPQVNGIMTNAESECPTLLPQGEAILSHPQQLEWEMAMMGSMGYPTFLDPLSINDDETWGGL